MENSFENLLSLKDAADMWHLEESTLRKAIASNKFIVNQDVKKFGKQWIITKEAMERVYGYLKKDSVFNDSISDIKKRQIYYFIFECSNLYANKYQVDIKDVNKEFMKCGIIDYLYECYDYLHLSNTNEVVKDIRSRIRRGVHYA